MKKVTNFFIKISNYFASLAKSTSEDSSKRFLSMYVVIVLITFIVVRYTDKHNVILVLGELIAFASALAVVGIQEYKNRKDENSK